MSAHSIPEGEIRGHGECVHTYNLYDTNFKCVYFRAADTQMYLLSLLNVCQFDA